MTVEGIVQYGKLTRNTSTTRAGWYLLKIAKCLFCRQRHTHGWNVAWTTPQPRVPHCATGPMGPDSPAWDARAHYWIAPLPENKSQYKSNA